MVERKEEYDFTLYIDCFGDYLVGSHLCSQCKMRVECREKYSKRVVV